MHKHSILTHSARGDFWGIITQNPNVSKSNWWEAVIIFQSLLKDFIFQRFIPYIESSWMTGSFFSEVLNIDQLFLKLHCISGRLSLFIARLGKTHTWLNRIFFFTLRYITWIQLEQLVDFLKSWTSTSYFSNSCLDHTKLSIQCHPWNCPGICWELDVAPPFFTLLWPVWSTLQPGHL